MNTYDPAEHPRAKSGEFTNKHRDEPESDGLAVVVPVISVPSTDIHGTTRWRTPDGEVHREDGPAVTWLDGSEMWCQHGKLHRLDGPAVIQPDGSMQWWENDQRKPPEVEAALTMVWLARTPNKA